MRLRVPPIEVVDEATAPRVGPVPFRVGLGDGAEEAPKLRALVEHVRGTERVADLVAEDLQAGLAARALRLEHLLPLESGQPRVREVERHAHAGDAVG